MASTRTRAQKKSKRSSAWLNHKGLVLSETVLALGLFQEVLEAWVLSLHNVPPMLRVVAGIGVVAGTLGSVMLVLRDYVQRGLHTTHSAIIGRFPMARLVGHTLVLTALFLGYAALWEDETGALGLAVHQIEAWIRQALGTMG